MDHMNNAFGIAFEFESISTTKQIDWLACLKIVEWKVGNSWCKKAIHTTSYDTTR